MPAPLTIPSNKRGGLQSPTRKKDHAYNGFQSIRNVARFTRTEQPSESNLALFTSMQVL